MDVAVGGDEEDEGSSDGFVFEVESMGGGCSEGGAVVELEVVGVVGDFGEGGVEGDFVRDVIEEVVVVVVLDQDGASGFEFIDVCDAVIEGIDDFVPSVAVVGEPFESHDAIANHV